jgi:hypothetical protein
VSILFIVFVLIVAILVYLLLRKLLPQAGVSEPWISIIFLILALFIVYWIAAQLGIATPIPLK